ncbi:MAG: VOC family protein [Gammaproteobacteria bacterium]|nr:VOC family protein [Gammaproteobacteria bacterium]
MELGAFSVSLAVKDLQAARAFYEKLGFCRTGGDGKGYLIMDNGGATIGLFQGMFEGNILTFNPGLRQDGSPLEEFTDIREIRESLVAGGIDLTTDTDPDGTGPAHVTLRDPDGNAILIDQFSPKPGTAGE